MIFLRNRNFFTENLFFIWEEIYLGIYSGAVRIG